MQQGVIFDMDGVIVDTEYIHMACEREIFRLMGFSITNEEHYKFVGTNDEFMWTILDQKYHLPVSVPEAITLKKNLYREYLKKEAYKIQPIPNVLELIIELDKKGVLLALASSSHQDQIEFILNKLSIKHYFKSIMSGDDISNCKPHPEIFLKSVNKLGVNSRSVMVIEDSENGVLAAKNANLKCIGYRNQNSGVQDLSKADLIINSFNEISATVIYGLLNQY